MKFVSLLIFFTTVSIALNTGIAAVVKSTCRPFSGYFFWHTGNVAYDSLIQYRRILVTLISYFPDNTSVSIETFGGENNTRFTFTKQAGHTNWTADILLYEPGNAFNNTIYYDEILRAISKQSRSSIQAEIVYILVDGKTEIYNSRNDFEELRKKKTFVLLTGKQTTNKTNYWLRLSTTKRHFVESYKEEDINKTVETIYDLSCQDSMFVCDTNMYWSNEKEGCNTCMYICCNSSTEQSTFCTRSCPYVRHLKSDKDITEGYDDHTEPLNANLVFVMLLNFGVTIITVIVGILLCRKRRRIYRCIKSLKGRVTASRERIPFLPRAKDKDSRGRAFELKQFTYKQNNSRPESGRMSNDRITDIELKVLS